jgi:tetratricopeptide (TPR) repeat protein
MNEALDELVSFNLIMRERSESQGDDIYRILRLTASFATSKLASFGDLERQAQKRLKVYYGASIPISIKAAEEMISRGATVSARQFIDEEILDREPDNCMALYLRGKTYQLSLQFTSAMNDYERALGKAHNTPDLVTSITLSMLELLKNDPQLSREDIVQRVRRSYRISEDMRLAFELAKLLEMSDKADEAKEYYEKVFRTRSDEHQDIWEESALFLIKQAADNGAENTAHKLVREALRISPGSKALVRWERVLAQELGLLKRPSQLLESSGMGSAAGEKPKHRETPAEDSKRKKH